MPRKRMVLTKHALSRTRQCGKYRRVYSPGGRQGRLRTPNYQNEICSADVGPTSAQVRGASLPLPGALRRHGGLNLLVLQLHTGEAGIEELIARGRQGRP